MTQRKDGRWQKIVTINGKRKTFYSKEPTEKRAERDIQRQLLDYSEEKENGLTFAKVADMWSREHFETLEVNSLKMYKPCTQAAIDILGDKRIKEITAIDIRQTLNKYAAKGYAQKTVKDRLLVINLIFKYAIVHGYTDNNPCQFVDVPKGLKKTKRKAPPSFDRETIMHTIDTPDGFFACFLMMTGCRRGEALALTYGDIDFENKTVAINKTVEWLGNVPRIKDHTKTASGMRKIPLHDELIKRLGRKAKKTDLVFPNYKGELYSNSNVTRMWERYRKDTGISVTPHQLRHQYATYLYEAGVDVKAAQYLMGHANIQTTMDIYTHLSEDKAKDSAVKIEEYLTQAFSKLK